MKTQTSRTPSYLVRNSYSYCFRMYVPRDLRTYINRKELRYSLRTGYVSEAKDKARAIAVYVQMIFKLIRKGDPQIMKLTHEQINEMVKTYLERIIDEYDKPTPPLEKLLEDGIIPAFSNEEYLSDLEDSKREYESYLISGNYKPIYEKADKLLGEQGVTDIDKNHESYWKLCRELMKAEIVGFKREIIKYTKDDSVPEIKPVIENNLANEPEAAVDQGELISTIMDKYVAEIGSQWEPETIDTYQATYKLFLEIMGDIPIKTIERKDIRRFKETLMKLPSNRNKKKKYQGKTIAQLVKMNIEDTDTLSSSTVNKELQRIGSVFEYAYINDYYPKPNPAQKMQIRDNRKDNERTAAFTKEELERLFSPDKYLNDGIMDKPFKFWIPIISLFHGMRQQEIAQLYLSDIQQTDDGVWYFDIINQADGKKVKDKKVKPGASTRKVPIHPFLLNELSFLKYCEKVKSQGHERVFHEITLPKRGGYGTRVSRWFNDTYKKKCDIADVDGRKKDFHSFRDTFITHAAFKQFPKEMRLQAVGHSRGKDESTRTYTEDFPPKLIYDEVISKIDFQNQIDLSHLKNSKYVVK